jgi:hypothetical protein
LLEPLADWDFTEVSNGSQRGEVLKLMTYPESEKNLFVSTRRLFCLPPTFQEHATVAL